MMTPLATKRCTCWSMSSASGRSSASRRLMGPQCVRRLRNPTAAVSTAKPGQLLAQLLELQAGAGSAIVEVAAVRRDALAEDLAIAAAAVGLILVEQPRDLAARAVRVPAHLEQPGLGAVGGGVAGGAVAAFAVAARRFAHAETDHQHEQVPQRIDPADVVAHAERREPRRRSRRARRDGCRCSRLWTFPLPPGRPARACAARPRTSRPCP